MSTKTDFYAFHSAKKSVEGRLSRLRKIPSTSFMREDYKSPIAKIGCFNDEIDSMEKTLKSMQNRLDNATITIPD